jgi:antirestriction protein ArdC
MYKKRNTGSVGGGQSMADKAVEKFTEMMIDRMERMKAGDWKKGWIDGEAVYGMPQNINGRNYSGSNSFFLQMDSAMHGYKTPVYMTFLQIQKENARINKGAEAMPVIYWDVSIKDANGKRVDRDDYRNMSREEQDRCSVLPFMKAYHVFNMDQTNLAEVNKEKYDKMVEQFKAPEMRDAKGMYENKALDRLFEKQEWVCPIQYDKVSANAYYSPSRDIIVVPKKEQFNIGKDKDEIYKDGMEYYSSALHEMAHSTGTENRLNRVKGDRFGDPKYAKEELVAELTAANTGYALGFDKRILDNNAAYLDGWISVLKENPKFIVSVMADVNKASNMVLEAVDKQRIALGEKPILQKGDSKQDVLDDIAFDNGAIIKMKSGEYAVRASYQGTELGMKPIDRETGARYFTLPDGKEKQSLLAQTLSSRYMQDIRNLGQRQSQSVRMAMG